MKTMSGPESYGMLSLTIADVEHGTQIMAIYDSSGTCHAKQINQSSPIEDFGRSTFHLALAILNGSTKVVPSRTLGGRRH